MPPLYIFMFILKERTPGFESRTPHFSTVKLCELATRLPEKKKKKKKEDTSISTKSVRNTR